MKKSTAVIITVITFLVVFAGSLVALTLSVNPDVDNRIILAIALGFACLVSATMYIICNRHNDSATRYGDLGERPKHDKKRRGKHKTKSRRSRKKSIVYNSEPLSAQEPVTFEPDDEEPIPAEEQEPVVPQPELGDATWKILRYDGYSLLAWRFTEPGKAPDTVSLFRSPSKEWLFQMPDGKTYTLKGDPVQGGGIALLSSDGETLILYYDEEGTCQCYSTSVKHAEA